MVATTTEVVAPAPDIEPDVSLPVIEEAVTPHGTWLLIEGRRVFRPNVDEVGGDFVPYVTAGHWIHTDVGWYFESEWDWGWAPFHYGRWYYDDIYGWLWVPDDQWGPAWVDWRESDEFVGWVPLAPPGMVVRFDRWTFVRSHDLVRRHLPALAAPRERVESLYPVARPLHEVIVRGHAGWSPGPQVTHVERASGQRVPTMPIPKRPTTVHVRRH